jgi:hypothetical protein
MTGQRATSLSGAQGKCLIHLNLVMLHSKASTVSLPASKPLACKEEKQKGLPDSSHTVK